MILTYYTRLPQISNLHCFSNMDSSFMLLYEKVPKYQYEAYLITIVNRVGFDWILTTLSEQTE